MNTTTTDKDVNDVSATTISPIAIYEKLYADQFQRCAVAAWQLAIYLNANPDHTKELYERLPEAVAASLEYMRNCRRIVEGVSSPIQTESLDLSEDIAVLTTSADKILDPSETVTI